MLPHYHENIITCWYSHISRVRYKNVKRFKKMMTVFLGLSVYSKGDWGASLMVQRFRICLSMFGTQIRTLEQEDSTYHGATKPEHHNC